MKTINTFLLSGILLSGFLSSAQAVENVQPCVQYAQAAWFIDGQSPYQAFNQCRNGASIGDPHITTFSGLYYDHNFPGVYRLMELNDGSNFSVLVRNVIDKAQAVSAYTITSAIKFQWVDHTVEIHRGKPAILFLDGEKITLKNNKTAQIGTLGYISRKGTSFFIAHNDADIAVIVNAYEQYLDVTVTVPNNADTLGLLGNTANLSLHEDNGPELLVSADPSDPLINKTSRVDFANFVESWRMADEGVFSEGDPADDPDYTAQIYTLADLTAKQLQKATNKCNDLETDAESFNKQGCLFDVGFGGKTFMKSNKNHQPSVMRMDVLN